VSQSEGAAHADQFAAFDTAEHRQAQLACHCIIHHAIDAGTRREAWESLHRARTVGDDAGILLALEQLTGECPHRLAGSGT
jgi:hypothetical protein